MSFAMFFLAEYVNMVTVSAVATSLYLGGWLGPFLPDWLGWIWFLVKVFLLLFFYVWMRWTLPRYRYDQLMEFGWKWLLPAAVLNLLATAALVDLDGREIESSRSTSSPPSRSSRRCSSSGSATRCTA